MDEWKTKCEMAAVAASSVGLESPELTAALKSSDTDEAMMALSPLMLMLDGARKVLNSVSPALAGALLRRVEQASEAAMEAFKATALASGFQPIDENIVCPVDSGS